MYASVCTVHNVWHAAIDSGAQVEVVDCHTSSIFSKFMLPLSTIARGIVYMYVEYSPNLVSMCMHACI